MGRIEPFKRQKTFVEIAAKVAKQCKQVRFRITGAALDTPEHRAYHREVRQLVATCDQRGRKTGHNVRPLHLYLDENVFDISQGVCILLCVKERDNPASATIYYADIWGSREEKYNLLSETDVQSTEWCEPQPTSPLRL